MEETKEIIAELLNPKDWDFTSDKDKLFTSNHVIEAYLKGVDVGSGQSQLILEKLISNINTSSRHINEILNEFRATSIIPESAYLKINSWDDFTIMFLVSEKDFLNDRIIKIYDFISQIEMKESVGLYNLHVSICNVGEGIEELNIKSDGFLLRHKV